MLEALKREVYEANMLLPAMGLVQFTWGNASAIDRQSGMVVIKPSGVSYEDLTPEKMVVVRPDGSVAEGDLRPSSDTPTHLVLYRSFPQIGGVVHTHSKFATATAQARLPIPAYGTTHADYFFGEIPCTRLLTAEEVAEAYEANTGEVIAKTFGARDPMAIPGVLAAGHGPFSWGKNAIDAAHNAGYLEIVAQMAMTTRQLCPDAQPLPPYVLEKHYLRKHGKNAYYGQK